MTTPAHLRSDATAERISAEQWGWVADRASGRGSKRGERFARKQAQKHAAKANKLDGMADRMERKRRVWQQRAVAMTDQMESA